MSTKFGIITSTTGMSAGITVNSLSFQDTVQQADARNEQGAITDITAYSRGQTVSVDGVLTAETSALATAGSILTLDSKSWLITDVSRNETNTDYVQVSIAARTADSATIRAIGGGGGSSDSGSSN